MRFFGFLLTVALVTLPFALAACGGPIETTDSVIATTKEGCAVHKIVRRQGMLSEEVFTTICPNGAARTEWETTRMIGKTVTTEKHAVDTPAR